MQKKLKVMFKNLKLIKIYKKIFLYVQERSKSLNVQKRSKIKFWETTVVKIQSGPLVIKF